MKKKKRTKSKPKGLLNFALKSKRTTHGKLMPKPITIHPCPEHGFDSGYIYCSWCRHIRQIVIKKLGLEVMWGENKMKTECVDCGEQKECRLIKINICKECEKKLMERLGYL